MTKREYFETIKNLVADNEELVAMTEHEIELLEKRSAAKSSKPTKTQLENEGIKEEILMVLASATEPMPAKDLRGLLSKEYSPQKVTALMTQLEKAGKAHKSYVNKTAVYSIA